MKSKLEYIKMHLRRYGSNVAIILYTNKPSCSYEVLITDLHKPHLVSNDLCVAVVAQGGIITTQENKTVVSIIRQWIKEKFLVSDISDKEFKVQYALGTCNGGRVYRLSSEVAANYTFDNNEFSVLSDIEWMRLEFNKYYIVQMENRWALYYNKVALRSITLNKGGTEKLVKRGILFKTRQGNWKLSPKYLTFKLGQRPVTKK